MKRRSMFASAVAALAAFLTGARHREVNEIRICAEAKDENGFITAIAYDNGLRIGQDLGYGTAEQKPLRGFPEGQVRICRRNEEFVSVYVSGKTGIRKFHVHEVEGYWEPAIEVGVNERPTLLPA